MWQERKFKWKMCSSVSSLYLRFKSTKLLNQLSCHFNFFSVVFKFYFHFISLYPLYVNCKNNVFCSQILFLVSWHANVAKWLSTRYWMRDVHGNSFAFIHWNDISTSLRVRIQREIQINLYRIFVENWNYQFNLKHDPNNTEN